MATHDAPVRAVLGTNSYGKSRVRLVKVRRDAASHRHEVAEVTADIALEGDFGAVHTDGDNSKCLPTDTMKNTVYALAKDHPVEPLEEFAVRLATHFVSTCRPVSAARVRLAQASWERVSIGGAPHPHCFVKGSEERQTCEARVGRNGARVGGGLESLVILKSTDSAFAGYIKDRYTTLPETQDRIMATSVTACWDYAQGTVDFAAARSAIRHALIEAFARHRSRSVQETLFEMGKAALGACSQIDRVRLSLPNKHCLLVNLAPFGLDNPNEIFVPTEEPHGLIEATIERA